MSVPVLNHLDVRRWSLRRRLVAGLVLLTALAIVAVGFAAVVLLRGYLIDRVDDHDVLRFEDLEMDEDRHEVRRAGEVIDLSPTEFALLRYLLMNSGRVLSKAQILDHVWRYDFGGDSGIVENYISYLRKKVDRIDPPLIHTLRGVGYSLRLPR